MTKAQKHKSGPVQRPDPVDNVSGILSMLAAQALLVGSDTCIKLVSSAISPWQFMAMRGVLTVVLMAAIVVGSGAWRHFGALAQPIVLVRSIIEALIALLFITAIAKLTLAEITVLVQTAPLILTILSAWVLAEKVTGAAWLAAVIGLGGVILVTQPETRGVSPEAWMALAVAALLAVRDLLTRRINPQTPSSIVAFGTSVVVCVLGWAGTPFQPWAPTGPFVLAGVFGSAVFVSVASFFMVRAFRNVDVSVVSPFRYVVVIWAMLAGALVFGDLPNAQALAGGAVIVFSGLALFGPRSSAVVPQDRSPS